MNRLFFFFFKEGIYWFFISNKAYIFALLLKCVMRGASGSPLIQFLRVSGLHCFVDLG